MKSQLVYTLNFKVPTSARQKGALYASHIMLFYIGQILLGNCNSPVSHLVEQGMAHHLGDSNQIQVSGLAVLFSSLTLLISASLPFSSNAIYRVKFPVLRQVPFTPFCFLAGVFGLWFVYRYGTTSCLNSGPFFHSSPSRGSYSSKR